MTLQELSARTSETLLEIGKMSGNLNRPVRLVELKAVMGGDPSLTYQRCYTLENLGLVKTIKDKEGFKAVYPTIPGFRVIEKAVGLKTKEAENKPGEGVINTNVYEVVLESGDDIESYYYRAYSVKDVIERVIKDDIDLSNAISIEINEIEIR